MSNGQVSPDRDVKPGKMTTRWRQFLTRRLWVIGFVIVAASGTIVAIVDATDYYFTSENFCAYSCHVMENTVYKELQQSKHWTTPSGVRAKCADCPRFW
jgi:nitrate/TMAO reductase-like tetraheme cytochrome c subunit